MALLRRAVVVAHETAALRDGWVLGGRSEGGRSRRLLLRVRGGDSEMACRRGDGESKSDDYALQLGFR